MKNIFNLNRILAFIAIAIVITVIFVSAVFICSRNVTPGNGLRKIENITSSHRDNAFDLIGILRITTSSPENGIRHVMVLAPWLEYDKNDSALYEELDRKLVGIKAIFNNYFSSRTKEELLAKSEEEIKAELLQQINDMLVLGKISRIYFKDYIFLN